MAKDGEGRMGWDEKRMREGWNDEPDETREREREREC